MELSILISQICALAAAAGTLSHWGYFIHGEHHLEAPMLFRLSISLPILAALGIRNYAGFDGKNAILLSAAVTTSYFTALWTSILIYRVFFHRLGIFPGPFMAKTSKLWHVWKLGPRSDNFRLLDTLQKKYGDFVRTGPSEITIFEPDAVPILLGVGSRCVKAPWYDGNYPEASLHTLRDKPTHDQRRRIWDRGFGAKALRAYETRVSQYSRDLRDALSRLSGQPTNATEWLHFYSFDVMGDFAFGKSFGMIKSGKSHFELDLLREGMKPLGVLGPIPWVFTTLKSMPFLGSGFKQFVAWCALQVNERKKMKLEVPDVMSWLVESYEKNEKGQKEEQTLLESEARLMIVAGSDTTASTLTYIFYHLARDPKQADRLRAELRALQDTNGGFSMKDLRAANHLNGIINEVLRMHPAVPSGVLRVTPKEGIMVGKTFIPGETTVAAPSYTIGRQESAYENANEFIPERWYSKPEMIKNHGAFAPFSIGPYSCVGKQLALMELRSVVTELVTHFDIKFAPGEDGSRLLNDSKDFFTVSLADLRLVFTSRAVE